MNPTHDFNRELTAWLVEEAPAKAPTRVLDGALVKASDLAQRPAWRLPERWIPMQATMRLATVSRGAMYAMFIIILALLLAIAVFVVGQQHRLPPLIGVAANGLIADDSRGQIALLSPTGRVVQTLTGSDQIAVHPAFSTDGQKVAFWTIPRPADVPLSASIDKQFGRVFDTPASLVSVDVASGTRTVLASNVRISYAPLAWSHAGDALAYTVNISQGSDNVFVVSSSGTQLAQVALASDPAWSPDDSHIALNKPNNGVFVVDRDGTNLTKVSRAYGLDFAFSQPDWSPDGAHIAYLAGAEGGYSVYVATSDGSNEQSLALATGQQAYWPRFSPNGMKLAYLQTATDKPGPVNWVVANPDGSNPVILPRDVWPTAGGWSPDGRYLIGYEGDQVLANIVLVDVSSGAMRRIPSSGSAGVSWQRLAP